MARIVLAMSGGVDSSVAARLLIEQGHDVIGVFMRHGVEPAVCSAEGRGTADSTLLPVINVESTRTDHKQGCCTARDAEDARRVADRLDIPFYALNLSNDFGRIIDYFVDEYGAGRTPNPCIMCNNWIKFGRLFDYADSVDAQFVATGHYAQLKPDGDDRYVLSRGRDESKDQSYVLFGIARKCLPRMMLPLGDYQKSQIRAMASNLGLRVADKKDSQEICFVTSGKHAEFVSQRRAKSTQGEIVTTDGNVVGTHPGIEGFTIGQRRGLRVAMGEPYFVVEINADENQVIIGKHDDLACLSLTARRTNWLVDPAVSEKSRLVQIRYNSQPVQASVLYSPAEDRLLVRFAEPCFGVAPGQAVVCYDGDQVLGGGWIETTSH